MKKIPLFEEFAATKDNELLLEMARVGEIEGKYEIYVNTNDDGNIPHFHLRDKGTMENEFHTCIEIRRNYYFHHNGKEDCLNAKMRKNLISFLESNDEYGECNWIVLIKEWNRNNSNAKIDISTPMPDYTTIQDNKNIYNLYIGTE